jgi:hypothetical protein
MLVATDGLSDPFDEDPDRSDERGFGVECFALTKDRMPASLGDSWLSDMLVQVASYGLVP